MKEIGGKCDAHTLVVEVLAVSAGSHRGTTGEGGAMYLRLLISCICDFSCYVFAGSAVMCLQVLLFVFATSPLMYFQLHLLCICVSHCYFATVLHKTAFLLKFTEQPIREQ